MSQGLKELLNPTVVIHVGSSVIEMSAADRSRINFVPPERNILHARENGIQPVNYSQLSQQFSELHLVNAILFDSVPNGASTGNHWRLTHIDDEHEQVTIQLCGSSGYYDEIMPAVTVSQKEILFTGINIMHYEKQGKSLSLATVAEKGTKAKKSHALQFIKNLQITETIYFADANGKLILKQDHPAFQRH